MNSFVLPNKTFKIASRFQALANVLWFLNPTVYLLSHTGGYWLYHSLTSHRLFPQNSGGQHFCHRCWSKASFAHSVVLKVKSINTIYLCISLLSFSYFPFVIVGPKEGGLFDDPSYVNVDKPRPPVPAANGNAHRDAFDMSECPVHHYSYKAIQNCVLTTLYHAWHAFTLQSHLTMPSECPAQERPL